MRLCTILALMLCGLLLRMHGWELVVLDQKRLGFLLVIGGSLVTASIVAVLAATIGS